MRGGFIRLVECLCLVTIGVLPFSVTSAQEPIRVIVNDVVVEPIPNEAAYQVTAYVTVAGADGQPISGLTTGAFTLSQDGSDVKLSSAAVAERPASFVFVIDTSGSMAYQGKMEAVKAAATGFVEQLAPQDQVAVVSFNDTVVIGQQDLTGDFVLIRNVMGLLEVAPNAGTCLYDAAYSAIELASKAPQGSRVVLLLTDGIDERADQSRPCSRHSVEDVKALAQDRGTRVPVYTIGVGTRVNVAELGDIAESTGGVSLVSPDAPGVSSRFDTIGAQIKNQYALVYQSETTGGEHNLTVTVTAREATRIGIRKFLAPKLPPMLNLSGLDNNTILTGSRKVRAAIRGEVEVAAVVFRLDGKPVAEASEAPFEAVLDAGTLSQGRHELVVTASLIDNTQLEESLAFEVQIAQAETAPQAAGDRSTVTIGLPIWLAAAAMAAAVALAGLLGFSLMRRKPRTRIVSGTAVASGRPEGMTDLTMDMMSGEVFAFLTVVESPTLRKGQAFDLSGDVVTIGRGANNSIIVPDPPVSRNHAEIRRQRGESRLFDLGSKYGTSVNDARVSEAGLPIRDGDKLRVGTRTTVLFNVIISQAPGSEDTTVVGGAGRLASSEPTIPADIRALDEGGTVPIDFSAGLDRGETLPAQVILPIDTGRDAEQARLEVEAPSEQLGGHLDEKTEPSDMMSDAADWDDGGSSDATLRSSG